jgi:hypothetical protein
MNEDFEDSVTRLFESISSGRAVAGQEDLDVVIKGLGRYIHAAFPKLTRDDIVDVVNTSLLRFTEATNAGRVDTSGNLGGYLATIGRNVALDMLRQMKRLAPTREETPEPPGEYDPRLESVIDALQSAAIIQTAMGRARAAGDHGVNDVVRAWLNLADQKDDKPTLREVATALGISHTEVRIRLRRLAGYLPS